MKPTVVIRRVQVPRTGSPFVTVSPRLLDPSVTTGSRVCVTVTHPRTWRHGVVTVRLQSMIHGSYAIHLGRVPRVVGARKSDEVFVSIHDEPLPVTQHKPFISYYTRIHDPGRNPYITVSSRALSTLKRLKPFHVLVLVISSGEEEIRLVRAPTKSVNYVHKFSLGRDVPRQLGTRVWVKIEPFK